MGDMLIYIILATVCTDLSRDIFYHKGHSIPVKSNGSHAVFGIPVLADSALHFIHKLSIERHFTGGKRAHTQFFLVGVPHDPINFPGCFGSVPGFPALLTDVCRHVFNYDDFAGSMCQKLRLSFAEFSFTETATIRNHSNSRNCSTVRSASFMIIRRVPRAIFRVVGYGQRAPDRMPDVDMTSFLVIYDISEFPQCPDNIPAGKDGEFVRHMSTATNVSFVPGR